MQYLIRIITGKKNKKVINYLQDSYDGSLDMNELKTFFNSFIPETCQSIPDFKLLNLKKLLNCPLMPGYIDGFSEDNTLSNYDQLSPKLFKVRHYLTY